MSPGSVALKEWDSEYDTLCMAIDLASGGSHYSQVLVKLFRRVGIVVVIVFSTSVVVLYELMSCVWF